MESEFLTEPTRKLRKSLLVASLIGFAISYAGLRVSEVSLLGSKLSITRFEVIPFVLGIVVSYFLVTFIIFGFHDYAQSYRKKRIDIIEKISKGTLYSETEATNALIDLQAELENLQTEVDIAEYTSPGNVSRVKKKVWETQQEISKLERVLEYYRFYKGSIFERLRLRGMKTLFDLLVPISIGLYVAILLFFFTKIPELNDTTLKPEQNIIVSEKVSSNDVNQVTSDTLINNSQRDEQIK